MDIAFVLGTKDYVFKSHYPDRILLKKVYMKIQNLPILLYIFQSEPNVCQCTIVTHNMYNLEKDSNNIVVSTLLSNPDSGMLTQHITDLILREKLLKFKIKQGQPLPVYVHFKRLYKTTFEQWLRRENKEYKSTFYEFNYLPMISRETYNEKRSEIIQKVHSFLKRYNFQILEKYQQINTRSVVHPKIYELTQSSLSDERLDDTVQLIYKYIINFKHLRKIS